MKTIFTASLALLAQSLISGVPQFVEATISAPSPTAVISYELDAYPAVVTMDIQTNSPSGWLSIGGRYFAGAEGDVNRTVNKKKGVIRWKARKSWPDRVLRNKGLRAVVQAWPVDDPPPYMVVDLRPDADCRVKYYARESDLCGGGVLGDDMYRTTHLVLKKIKARGVRWTMGSILETTRAENETPHTVMLDSDYYIGVFEMTQRQCVLGANLSLASQFFYVDGDMRPAEGGLSFTNLRGDSEEDSGTLATPTGDSIIGRFRSLTQVDFDLPSEAQWEYACRSGIGEGYWPEGSPQLITGWNDSSLKCYNSPSLDYIGRYRANGGVTDKEHYGTNTHRFSKEDAVGPTNGTAVAGSYVPNSWGLYDMCGNVYEWCLDWYREDITSLNGAPVTERGEGDEARRVVRGGSFYTHAGLCRPSCRTAAMPKYELSNWGFGGGFRLCAPCIAR